MKKILLIPILLTFSLQNSLFSMQQPKIKSVDEQIIESLLHNDPKSAFYVKNLKKQIHEIENQNTQPFNEEIQNLIINAFKSEISNETKYEQCQDKKLVALKILQATTSEIILHIQDYKRLNNYLSTHKIKNFALENQDPICTCYKELLKTPMFTQKDIEDEINKINNTKAIQNIFRLNNSSEKRIPTTRVFETQTLRQRNIHVSATEVKDEKTQATFLPAKKDKSTSWLKSRLLTYGIPEATIALLLAIKDGAAICANPIGGIAFLIIEEALANTVIVAANEIPRAITKEKTE